jgi:hypothetical protein
LLSSSTVAVAAGLAGFAGSLMTWASASTSAGSISRTGIGEGHGKVTAAAALILVLCVVIAHGRRIQLVVAALVAVAGTMISIYHWGYVQDELDNAPDVTSVSVGIGLYLCTFGFIICLGALMSAMPDNPDAPRPH